MAILHGSWLPQLEPGSFFLWGETWRRVEPIEASLENNILPHPLAMTPLELVDCLRSLQQSGRLNWEPPEAAINQLQPNQAKRSSRKKTTAKQTKPASKAASRKLTITAKAPTTPLWRTQTINLGTQFPAGKKKKSKKSAPLSATPIILQPQHSAATADPDIDKAETPKALALYPWQVEGLCLDAKAAMKLLRALPLGTVAEGDSFIGGDLRFWSHIARWSLDLLARSKFLPGLDRTANDTHRAQWNPLLDSAVDQARLESFAQHMPLACRTYQHTAPQPTNAQQNPANPDPASHSPLYADLLPDAKTLLQDFLSSTLDAQIRPTIAPQTLPTVDDPVRSWLKALGTSTPDLPPAIVTRQRLDALLGAWTTPLQQYQAQVPFTAAFHACFYLHPPKTDEKTWHLEYCLQAADDAAFFVDAQTIWSHPVERLIYMGRTIHQPQESLLSGLGLASRIYPLLEISLQSQYPQSCELDPLQAYEFLKSVAWRLQDSGFGVILPPSLTNREGWASRLGLKIRAQAPRKSRKREQLGLQSLLNFKWELSIGGQTLSKAEFDRLVALDTPLVEINGEWVELRPQDIRAAQSFFASRKDQTSLSLQDALRISTGDTQTIEKLPVVNFEASGSLQGLIETLTSNQSVKPLPAPDSFKGELRPYQERGTAWLTFLEQWGLGACLADDMGLGKTIQLIAFLLHLQEQETLEDPTLLICPTSVLGNWEREVKRFGPSLKTLVYHGPKRPQKAAFKKAIQGKHLVITSYALVYRNQKELQSTEWQMVVLDEAQNIKNPDSKQSQAVRQLEGQFRVALTGTPVENRLSELWSILDFLNPGYLGPRNFFQRRFAIPIERYGDMDSLQTLRSLVQPFILRRLKTDRDIIQDLPEKQEMTVFCGLSAEQAALYQKVVDKSLDDINEAGGIQRRGMILALLVKLKQVCNHPAQFLGEPDLGKTQRSGKLQRLQEMLDEILSAGDVQGDGSAERALIFTQFAEWGKLLKAYLEKQLGRETFFLYGSSSKKQREAMIDRFQHDPQGPRIMILSLKAGGVGLNLTRANHVFHFDRWWNPAVENQATDRVFRIGQTRNVQVHKFVCTGTLEEKIHEIIESKRALAEQVVGAGEQWLTELDTDQLRNLLLLDRGSVIDEE